MNLFDALRQPARRNALRRSLTDMTPRVGPYHVAIIPTYRCDYGCVFCGLGLNRAEKRPDLDVGLLPPLLEDLTDLLTWEVSLTGGGEPSVHPEFPTLVRMIQAAGFRLTVSTHGRWLTRPGTRIYAGPWMTLHVSVNAATPATYDRVHRLKEPGTFDRLTAALRELAPRSGSRQIGRLSMSFVFCEPNVDEIRPFYDLAASIGADAVVYRLIIPHPGYQELIPTQPQIQRAFAELDALRREAEKPGTPDLVLGDNFVPPRSNADRVRRIAGKLRGRGKAPLTPAGLIQRYRAWSWKTTGKIPCLEGFLNSYIESDGTVFACHGGGSRHANNVMGDLNEERFAEIWRGRRYRDYRRETLGVDVGIAGHSIFPGEDTCLRCPKRDLFADTLSAIGLPPEKIGTRGA